MENFKGKSVLTVGMGKSGMAATAVLVDAGARVTVYDGNEAASMKEDFLTFLKAHDINAYFGKEPENLSDFQMMVVSPGVPLDIPLMLRAKELKIKVIGELELAYILGGGCYAAITGTNGKTTTTTLVGEIFKAAGRDTRIVGNIGNPVVGEAVKSGPNTWLVTEVSSFQLETVKTFRPKISALLNLTPDHLNRHKTMEEYGRAKAMIYKNQTEEDFFVVNYDDEPSISLSKNCRAKIVPFSRKFPLTFGACLKDGWITVKGGDGTLHQICRVDEIKILGAHNVENVLAACAICFFSGIEAKVIGDSIRTFQGVEHRLEVLEEIGGVRFINDSKGTNPDASIKAIEAMNGGVILIAGGYDKNSDFAEFIEAFDGKVDRLILLGKTASKIKEAAEKLGFKEIFMARDMEECVNEAFRSAKKGGTVLLSPACASWDMYTSYEVRGEHFKKCVEKLKS